MKRFKIENASVSDFLEIDKEIEKILLKTPLFSVSKNKEKKRNMEKLYLVWVNSCDCEIAREPVENHEEIENLLMDWGRDLEPGDKILVKSEDEENDD